MLRLSVPFQLASLVGELEKGKRRKPCSARAMENGGASGSGPNSPAQAGGGVSRRQPRAGADPLLIVCRCFGVVTAATAFLCVAVNVLSAVLSFRGGTDVSPPPELPPSHYYPARAAMGARELIGDLCVRWWVPPLPQIFGGIFRCYAVVFAIFVGVLETEWEFIIKFWKVCSVLFSPFRFAPIWDATDWL
jgi:hypothetical protein